MAGPQYVYHMQGVSKTYPGGKQVFENIHLSFLPTAKIGVVGVNGDSPVTVGQGDRRFEVLLRRRHLSALAH